jgi:S-(hydroxymethyl)glutathione dehydrogenase / alcohol dehydrogenase
MSDNTGSDKPASGLSRRDVLKAAGATAGVAATVGGAVSLLSGASEPEPQGAPAVLTNTQAGRKFRAYVKLSNDIPTVIQVTARALQARQIAVRMEAAQTCYTSVDECLIQGTPVGPAGPNIVGHGGVGIVEAIGPAVNSVRVGDRVVIPFHKACGRCFNCLWMRSDKCLNAANLKENYIPAVDLPDGKSLISPIGGMTEILITNEEQTVPVFTDASSVELAMLTCVGGCGLGMAMTNVPVELASDVVVFGAGPVGLSALQGAKLKGATQIIVVDPIKYRRDLAMTLGATATVDPNQFKERNPPNGIAGLGAGMKDALVDHLRDMCKLKTDRLWAGGGRVGPDHIIEAVGGDRIKPKEVQGPDPTGVQVLEQCWDLCSQIGTLATCSVGQPDNAFVRIKASQWADGAKHHWPGTGGGTNDRRDVPRFARLIEHGQLNMKALASKTYPLSQAKEAYQAAADRTVVATVVTPNA